jgi:hypothetical protein
MKRTIVSLFLFSVFLGTTFAFPRVVHADTTGVGDNGVCNSVTDAQSQCKDCFNSGGAWTAVGCIGGGSGDSTGGKLGDFIQSFLQIGIGAGGGIAFLLILFSGFQTMMSAGNPEKLHEAKELMTAAISGLLLIIFSVFLLKLIGVDILQLPGFAP